MIAYYQNLKTIHKSLGPSTDDFIGELSSPLQLEIKLVLYRRMLLRIPFLKNAALAVIESLLSQSERLSFADVKCGSQHTLLLGEVGGQRRLYSWGNNEHGALALGKVRFVCCFSSLLS